MQLSMSFVVFSIVTSCLPHQSYPDTSVTQKSYQKLQFDDLVVSQDAPAKEHVASKLHCGQRCSSTEGCVMFTFLPGQDGFPGECRMYEQLVTSITSRKHSSGARSYGLKELVQKCSSGYSLVCDRCLRFIDTSMNFAQGKDACQGLDQGHLVIAKTAEAVNCVASFARDSRGSDFLMFFGADDLAVGGTFVWHDGTVFPSNSPLWHAEEGQPDGDPYEDCACAYTDIQKMRDCYCTYETEILCEKDAD